MNKRADVTIMDKQTRNELIRIFATIIDFVVRQRKGNKNGKNHTS